MSGEPEYCYSVTTKRVENPSSGQVDIWGASRGLNLGERVCSYHAGDQYIFLYDSLDHAKRAYHIIEYSGYQCRPIICKYEVHNLRIEESDAVFQGIAFSFDESAPADTTLEETAHVVVHPEGSFAKAVRLGVDRNIRDLEATGLTRLEAERKYVLQREIESQKRSIQEAQEKARKRQMIREQEAARIREEEKKEKRKQFFGFFKRLGNAIDGIDTSGWSRDDYDDYSGETQWEKENRAYQERLQREASDWTKDQERFDFDNHLGMYSYLDDNQGW